MTIDQVVTWVIVGGIAGIIAEFLINKARVGLVGTILIGIIGALLGGWLFGVLHIKVGSGFIGEIIVAAVGAVVLLGLLRVLNRV